MAKKRKKEKKKEKRIFWISFGIIIICLLIVFSFVKAFEKDNITGYFILGNAVKDNIASSENGFLSSIYNLNGIFLDIMGIQEKQIGKMDEGENGKIPDGTSFYLDVGAVQDNDSSMQAFILSGTGISDRIEENGISYRNLSNKTYFNFKINTSSLNLAANGVPYKNAILEIRYKDNIDETNCDNYDDHYSYCRPYLEINLSYGNLAWQKLEGIGGINDNLWKNETMFIENNYWQVLKSIGGNFNFRIYYPNPLNNETPLPIDYIKLTFYNNSEFNRLRELDRINRTFIRKDYIESNTLNISGFQKNYLIYSRNYLEKIYPNTVPNINEIVNNISTFEISGNYEPITFSIYAFENLNNVNVSVSDLINGNNIILKENIRVDKVVSIDKRWQYSYSQYYGTNPWYLDNVTIFNVTKNTSQQVWLTIYVPINTPKGDYKGQIQISGDNLESSELGLSLEVFDVALEEPDAIPYLYSSPYRNDRYYSNPKDAAAIDMSLHNINPILSFYPYVNSSFGISFTKSQNHLSEISRYKELDILASTALVSISDNNADIWSWTQGNSNTLIGNSSEFDRVYINILRQYKEFFNSYGITPIVSFNDEPGMDKSRRRLANHFNKLANDAGLKTWVTYYDNCEIPLYFKMYFNCSETANTGDYAQYEAEVNKNEVPEILNWNIYDSFGSRHSGHNLKILVNDNLVLNKSQNISYYHGPFNLNVNLSEYPGKTVNIKIRMEASSTIDCSNQYYYFGVYPYFENESWLNQNWQFTVNHQSYYGEIDNDIYLGPMDSWLDYRVYALSYVTEKQINLTSASNDTFMYYTTYPANQPVIVNNRFLNGIYASATKAKGVNVYAYGDWGQFPYDDMSTSYKYRLGTIAGLRSQGRYELVLPSWEPRVYDTLAYESLREGIEDSKIIAALKKSISDHPGEKANEAQAYLNQLLSKPCKDCYHNPDNRYMDTNSTYIDNSSVYYAPEKYADRSEEILYDLSGNRTNYSFFNAARKTMINYIIELNLGTTGGSDNSGGSSGGTGSPGWKNQSQANQTVNQTKNGNASLNILENIREQENPSAQVKKMLKSFSKKLVVAYVIYCIIILTCMGILIIIYIIIRNIRNYKKINSNEEISFD